MVVIERFWWGGCDGGNYRLGYSRGYLSGGSRWGGCGNNCCGLSLVVGIII